MIKGDAGMRLRMGTLEHQLFPWNFGRKQDFSEGKAEFLQKGGG